MMMVMMMMMMMMMRMMRLRMTLTRMRTRTRTMTMICVIIVVIFMSIIAKFNCLCLCLCMIVCVPCLRACLRAACLLAFRDSARLVVRQTIGCYGYETWRRLHSRVTLPNATQIMSLLRQTWEFRSIPPHLGDHESWI